MKKKLSKLALAAIFAGLVLANGSFFLKKTLIHESEQSFLFGLSLERLILAIYILITSLGLLIFILQMMWHKGWFYNVYNRRIILTEYSDHYNFWVLFIIFIFFLSISFPGYLFGKWEGYWINFLPILQYTFFASIIIFCVSFFYQISSTPVKFREIADRVRIRPRDFLKIGFIILCVGLILLFFKSSLNKDPFFWNVAAVPVLPQYAYLAFFIFFFWLAYLHIYQKKYALYISSSILVLFIFMAGNAILQKEEITKNYFVQTQSGPPVEYYPYSDALTYDLSGIGVINGLGIDLRTMSDKPLFAAYIGMLHFIMGNDYQHIILLNVFFLALIPVFLFLIGKLLDSAEIGLLFAAASILFEITTFKSSGYIPNIHWKLLMTEPWGQLMILSATCGTILWLKNSGEQKWLFLTGGALGIGSYIRPQIIFLLLAFLLIVILKASGKFWLRLSTVGKSIASFLCITLPWGVYTFARYHQIPLLGKFQWIQEYRFSLGTEIQQQISRTAAQPIIASAAGISSQQTILGRIYLIFTHFLNNTIKTLLILPYSIHINTVPNIFKGITYWDETANWQGEVTFVFFLSLIIFSIGLIGLYRKNKSAGLIPILYMLFYFAALSISRTSGSRYVVPVVWVVYLYYFYGIVLIARFFFKLLFVKNPNNNRHLFITDSQKPLRQRSFLFLFLPLLFGLTLPAIDYFIPTNQQLVINNKEIQQRIMGPAIFHELDIEPSNWEKLLESNSVRVGYGEMVYPIFNTSKNSEDQNTLTFSLVGNYPMQSVNFPLDSLTANQVASINQNGIYFVLACEEKETSNLLPFLLQSKDSKLSFVSHENWGSCKMEWDNLQKP